LWRQAATVPNAQILRLNAYNVAMTKTLTFALMQTLWRSVPNEELRDRGLGKTMNAIELGILYA